MQQSQADYSQALGHQHFALADVFHSLNLSGNALFNTGMSLYRIQSGKEDNAPASTISLETIDGGDNPEVSESIWPSMNSTLRQRNAA
jgi:hypothetical protein